ncbi:SMI1/KNR4 family protein [Clostridium diolis]|uniref:SMI1/KNR4 family protein n=1 Tax=Clostridium diolis TaxID=223919 RepID=UPI003AF548FE
MNNFHFLSEYIVDKVESSNDKRHIFYRIDKNEVTKAENRMINNFPSQLKEFYLEIGYGFLCKDDRTHTNRLMHPSDIADFYCEDEVYNYVDRDLYESNEMIFFDLGGEGDFLTLKLDEEDKGTVYYFGKKIADSLKDFLIKMDLETNYYMKK